MEVLSIKNARMVVEILGRVGSEKTDPSSAAATALDFGMTMQILRQTFGDDLALSDQPRPWRKMSGNLPGEQRIMGTGQQDRIDIRSLGKQPIDIGLHKIICSRPVVLIVFDERDP